MGFFNRPMGIIRGLGEKIKSLAKKPIEVLGIGDKEKTINEKRDVPGWNNAWGQFQGRLRWGWIRQFKARRKKANKKARNSRRVNRGGKKR